MGTPGSLILPGEGSCCWHCRHRHPSSVRQANKFRVGFAPGRCFAPLVMPAATASIHSAAAAANGPFQDRAAIHKPGTLPPQACPSRSPHAAGAQRDLPAAGLLRSPASARNLQTERCHTFLGRRAGSRRVPRVSSGPAKAFGKCVFRRHCSSMTARHCTARPGRPSKQGFFMEKLPSLDQTLFFLKLLKSGKPSKLL